MNKYLVSFGQSHTHRINGKTFDCDTLMELEDKDYESAYQHAFDLTEGKFGTLYENEKRNDPKFISLFPKGIIPLNYN